MSAKLPWADRVPYSRGVLIGEWYEQNALEEAEKEFVLQKLNRHELLIQNSRDMMHNLYKPVELSVIEYVSFDYPIQLKAPLTKSK